MVKMLKNIALVFMLMIAIITLNDPQKVFAETGEDDLLEGFGAESIYVCETATDHCICERDSDKVVPMRHFAKLMTVLLCAEELEKGTVALDDEVVASPFANSMPSPQIWLETGDRITVEELIKSITIGNANDACAALAEKLSGSEKKHIDRMNEKAKELEMLHTHFEDCVGLADETASTAKDLYILSKSIVKYKGVTDYFGIWLDKVKCQGIELVNNNRLIRTYKGCVGIKAFGSESGKYSLISAVNKGNMLITAVIMNETGKDIAFSRTVKLLDEIFDRYNIYRPRGDRETLTFIKVINGRSSLVYVKPEYFAGVLLEKGELSGVEYDVSLPDDLHAPIYCGDEVGKIVYSLNGKNIAEVKICAAETVEKMDIIYSIYHCLCNLFKL